jgi:hypothetical protein
MPTPSRLFWQNRIYLKMAKTFSGLAFYAFLMPVRDVPASGVKI